MAKQAFTGAPMTRRRAIAGIAMLCGAACMGAGIGSVAHEAATARSYSKLASSTRTSRSTPATEVASGGDNALPEPPRHDWDKLKEVNGDTAAWISVQGTDIDLPVVATADTEEESWYLSHDLWGSSSASGTPFLDWRCPSPDGRHLCVYAHHMTSSQGMFSQLQNVYEQDAFERLGSLTWETPSGLVRAQPLCALRVDASWSDIQRFDWGRPPQDTVSTDGNLSGGFNEWLAGIASNEGARCNEALELAETARRCFTLVTCSSDFSYQRWRTLALWAC